MRSYSGGIAQRLKIARAMMHAPKILFLDEPTTGLDPNYREILWREMLNLNREAGTTIFLTTHYMVEPERLARHMVIVNHGQIVAKGTSPEPKALVPTLEWSVIGMVAAIALMGGFGFRRFHRMVVGAQK